MTNLFHKKSFLALLPVLSVLVFGFKIASAADIGTVTSEVYSFLGYIPSTITALALLTFLWGIVVYLYHGNEEAMREEGRTYMIWGLVGLFVMVTVWGLIRTFAGSLGILNN